MADASTSVVEQTSIPAYARPYVEELLGAAAGQTFRYAQDPSGNFLRDAQGRPQISGVQSVPTYQGERFAQFTPLQLQAFQQAQNMGIAPQLAGASWLAGQAGGLGLGAGAGFMPSQLTAQQVGTQTFGTPQMEQYMSPYMQGVVDVQQREAQRQAGIARTGQQAEATRAGAFGGGRDAIMRAEADRNLATQLGSIQAGGLQAAFQQAQQQFNADQARSLQAGMANQTAGLNAGQIREQSRQFGAGLGMQGAQTGLQAAATLGNLGQTQFGQQTGIANLQNQFGTQQQQQVQNILGSQYQDFMEQRDAPYTRMGYFSNMLRGLPLQQSSTVSTPPAPNALSSIVGLGTAAAGLGGLFRAKGGIIPKYAEGGSITSPSVDRVEAQLEGMSGPQLKQIAISNPKNLLIQGLLDQEHQRRQKLQTASMEPPPETPVLEQLSQQLAQLPEDTGIARLPVANSGYADGGIIGYAGGGKTSAPAKQPPEDPYIPAWIRDFRATEAALQGDNSHIDALMNAQKEYEEAQRNRIADYMKGRPTRASYEESIEALRADETRDPERAKRNRSMALLQAGLGIMGGRSPHFFQNLAGAAPAVAGYQEAENERERRARARDVDLRNVKLAKEAAAQGDYDLAFKLEQGLAESGQRTKLAGLEAAAREAERRRTVAGGAATAAMRERGDIEAARIRVSQLGASASVADKRLVLQAATVQLNAAKNKLAELNKDPLKFSAPIKNQIDTARKQYEEAAQAVREISRQLGVPAPAVPSIMTMGGAPGAGPAMPAGAPGTRGQFQSVSDEQLKRIIGGIGNPQGR